METSSTLSMFLTVFAYVFGAIGTINLCSWIFLDKCGFEEYDERKTVLISWVCFAVSLLLASVA